MGPQMLRLSFPRRLNRAVHFYDFRESKHIVFMAPKNIKQETAETWGFRLLDKVYDSLFFLTTLRFGEWYTVQTFMKKRNLATHSLALLRVCRKIWEETKSLWIGRVLFDFNHVITLLDKLSSLTAFILSHIRFIQISTDPLVLRVEVHNHHPFYRLVWALKRLPRLRLDTLTVFGTFHGFHDYVTLGTLIQHGNCWKELRFVTRDSSMLGFRNGERMVVSEPYRRKPQPLTWNEIFLARDGIDSKASVRVYRANQEMEFGAALTPDNSREFNQEIAPPETLEEFEAKEHAELMSPNESGKPLLVVAKRGHQADISERDTGPYHPDDNRYWSDGMTWQEMKGMISVSYRRILYRRCSPRDEKRRPSR